jgi:hypothetical protein
MDSLLDTDLENPSLDRLHGCSLVAVYWLASRPNKKAAFLVGIVVRIAYSLGLNVIDQDLRASEPPQVTDVEWARREELRRAWWLVFECDNFASVIRCQPLTIDRSRMHVLLPSSDHHWFSQTPCLSAFLEDDAAQSWRNLEKSPNRNPHAWYLLANDLMIRAHEAVRSVCSDPQRRLDIHDAARYAAMSVPPELNLSNDVLSFDEETAGHDNWVIALHMMLQGYGFSITPTSLVWFTNCSSALLYALGPETPLAPDLQLSSHNPGTADEAAGGSQESIPNSSRRFRPALNSLLRILRNWSPDFCASVQPFQVCVLLGPYAANLQATFAAPSPSRGEMERALIRSTIARIAEYWSVGGSALGTFIKSSCLHVEHVS